MISRWISSWKSCTRRWKSHVAFQFKHCHVGLESKMRPVFRPKLSGKLQPKAAYIRRASGKVSSDHPDLSLIAPIWPSSNGNMGDGAETIKGPSTCRPEDASTHPIFTNERRWAMIISSNEHRVPYNNSFALTFPFDNFELRWDASTEVS